MALQNLGTHLANQKMIAEVPESVRNLTNLLGSENRAVRSAARAILRNLRWHPEAKWALTLTNFLGF